MNITRDVITDLLPSYFSGEASRDTQLLVEDFLRQDPEFARVVEKSREKWTVAPPELPVELERKTLLRTKRLLRRRMHLFGLALFFSGLLLSLAFSEWANKAPLVALLVTAAIWIAALAIYRRARPSGL